MLSYKKKPTESSRYFRAPVIRLPSVFNDPVNNFSGIWKLSDYFSQQQLLLSRYTTGQPIRLKGGGANSAVLPVLQYSHALSLDSLLKHL